MAWTLADVLSATGGTPLGEAGTESFSAICTDTRELLPGCLFVPLRGENFDGHQFVAQALEKGAAAALWARPEVPPDLPAARLVRVADGLRAYQDLGAWHLRRLGIPTVAVTGSVGKTTTKDLCAALLGSRLRVHKSRLNYNNEVGLPRTLLELGPEHEVAVLEMAMRGPGQIRQLARLVRPQVGIVTTVGESHLEFFDSREGIARAKGELLEELDPRGVAILPRDCDFFPLLLEQAGSRRVLTFSATRPADYCVARATSLGLEGWRLELLCQGRQVALRFPLPGRHNLADLLAALAAAAVLGVAPEEAAPAAEGFRPAEMRSEIHRLADGTVVLDDSYNAAPASMEGALEVLATAPGRRLAVLGDMLELGPLEEEGHRRVGRAAARAAQVLLAVGPRSRALADEARRWGLAEVHWVPDAQAAWEALLPLLRPGDTVLVKASRGTRLDLVARRLLGQEGGEPEAGAGKSRRPGLEA